ncbi:MAG: hypothetical protein FD180_1324 [Planctomycetota bacterium]|nr:MAG: hypothetical protein FD180_1324 [Planctomycetota bacterium]
MRRALFALAASPLLATFVGSEDPKLPSGGTPVLVELFSSQG